MNFSNFSKAIQNQYDKLTKGELFFVEMDRDELYATYLASFPEGTNPVYKTRTEYDCTCCKQFIRNTGHVVGFVDGQLTTIWDIDSASIPKEDSAFLEVALRLHKYVISKPIAGIFRSDVKKLGNATTHQHTDNGVVTWHHFSYELPAKFVVTKESIAEFNGRTRTNKELLERGLTEISIEACEVVKDLIAQNSLYRGAEHVKTVELAIKLLREWDTFTNVNNQNWLWAKAAELGEATRFKNSVIGTLLVDITSGVELEHAVKSFESKVAPQNYKRPTALITPGMIKKAQEQIVELGLEAALYRRYAVTEDLTVNNVLFADRSAKKVMTGVFDELLSKTKDKAPEMSKVQELTIQEFLDNVLPGAESLELMLDNKHTANLMSVIAPMDSQAGNILKWNNNFSWSYNGEVADSMKERVKSLGGRVDGVLRFTHSWNHNDDNQSLMDLHVFFPDSGYVRKNPKEPEIHNNYPSGRRVGWNKRTDIASKAIQDVDYVEAAPIGFIPLENISFPDLKGMPEGTYIMKIHNWNFRGNTRSGFKAEIEFGNQLFQYDFPKALKHHEWITVAEVTLKNGQFTIEHKLDTQSSVKEVWGVATNKWTKVNLLMNSPNHWDDNTTGNKHWFFVLDGCKNPDDARGFYNEFLKDDLQQHRKVFETLGAQLKAKYSDNQLSGVGFSSTIANSVLCKVSGTFNRIIKITF